MSKRDATSALLVIAVCAIAAIAPLFTGCETIKRVDEAIWNQPPPAGIPGANGDPAGDRPPVADVPPIIEIIASALALGGFTGMAGWIRKVRNAGNGRLTALEDKVRALETHQNT